MSRFTLIAALAAALAAVTSCRGEPIGPAPLVLERVIPLPGVAGRIDHMAVDSRHDRLFVAELGAGALDEIDLATGRSLARLTGLKEPQGVGYLASRDEVVAASGGDGSVSFLSADGLVQRARVPLGDDADDVRVDAANGFVVVGYGTGALATIDPVAGKVTSETAVGAHPEGFSLDERAGRAFVNLPDRRTVAEVDLKSGRELRAWNLGLRFANFPMAVDTANGLVAVVFRLPGDVVLYREDGSQLAATAACGDADDVYFDLRRRRLYVSCGDGRIVALRIDGRNLRRLATIESRPGARTSIFSPDLDRLIVAAPAHAGQPAAILIYRPAG